MAQGQKQYNEKPHKVLAEQFDASALPLQVGVCVCTLNPMGWTDGRPHVHTPRALIALGPTDWIVEDLWTPGVYDVMPDAEFQARFGGGNLADVTPAEG
jgi:hypothetical protein